MSCASARPEGEPVASTVSEYWFERCALGRCDLYGRDSRKTREAQLARVLADHHNTQTCRAQHAGD